jgi:hypothetical protein
VEFPHIQALVDKYGSRGFVVVTLNTMPTEDAAGQRTMTKKGYRFTHLTTPSNEWATQTYKFQGAPTTVLLDQNGKVMLRHLGYSLSGVHAMDRAILALLRRGRPTT